MCPSKGDVPYVARAPLEAFPEPASRTSGERLKNIMPAIITTTDLTPVLQPQGTDLYFTSDPHWNSNGHQVVADWLIEQYTNRSTVD